jgi:hypothetical protein
MGPKIRTVRIVRLRIYFSATSHKNPRFPVRVLSSLFHPSENQLQLTRLRKMQLPQTAHQLPLVQKLDNGLKAKGLILAILDTMNPKKWISVDYM